MIIKKYFDDTYNIQYQIGDYVKVKNNPKFGEADDSEEKWGEVKFISGKPLTAKLTIETEDGETIEQYIWNVKPTDENGNLLTDDETFNLAAVVESIDYNLELINENNSKIIKFSDI
jgi:hypothetical protein